VRAGTCSRSAPAAPGSPSLHQQQQAVAEAECATTTVPYLCGRALVRCTYRAADFGRRPTAEILDAELAWSHWSASSIRPCVTLLIIALFARMIYGQKLPFLRSICCTIRCKVCSRCRFLLLFLPRTCTCFSGSTESTVIVSNTTYILNFKHHAHFVCKREDGHCSYGFPSVLVRFGILKPKHREKCASWRHGVCTNG